MMVYIEGSWALISNKHTISPKIAFVLRKTVLTLMTCHIITVCQSTSLGVLSGSVVVYFLFIVTSIVGVVIALCFVVRYLMYILVLQSS